ncbi:MULTISPECIES: alkaline phosphatase family protein [Pseudarthrobacter]|uniref:alkaline phosphatase family protein n=1 Tax=Pseudarthrobacter TaxID=1742993 RepID=UPI00351FFBD5
MLLGAALFIAGMVLSGCTLGQPVAAPTWPGIPGHVFVINLENQGYDRVFGNGSAAPYLTGTLRAQGVLLTQYYGIAHDSLPNYLAQISGQPPNDSTSRDCRTFSSFVSTGTDSQGRLTGDGCVYPANVPTLAGQLTAAGKTWKGYMEDMPSPCLHPAVGAEDNLHKTSTDQYATRHDPFVYFRSITDTADCTRNVVNYSALANDLGSVATTPNLAYITPNLCHDGHDNPCTDGTPGGLAAADQWLRTAVPSIVGSPAYKQDGMLIITFDEADDGRAGPSTTLPGGSVGGQIGTLVLSPYSTPGGTSAQPYNHYSLLASIEDFFSLPRLGTAAEPGITTFGPDVYNAHA